MLGINLPSPRHFAVVRMLLGCYLAWHFWSLVPYAGELFSTSGMLPDARQLPTALFPNPLAAASASSAALALSIGCALALALAAGVWRRPLALVLWFGWACLLNRNPFISNPSIPYVGWLLLACAIIPNEAPLRPSLPRPDDDWAVPQPLLVGAFFLLGLGYTLSGLHKLASPSWLDGSAVRHVLELPLARDTALRDAALSLPRGVFAALAYSGLIAEVTALPLLVMRWSRSYAWWGLGAMQLGILCFLDFADLTLGMLLFHAFVFDVRWLPGRRDVAD